MTLRYAHAAYAKRGQATEVAGSAAIAAMQTAHAVLAARGEWTTNEKRLLERAGLRDVDAIVTAARSQPESLNHLITQAEELFAAAG